MRASLASGILAAAYISLTACTETTASGTPAMSAYSPRTQIAFSGMTIDMPTVRVHDEHYLPLGGIPVTFSVTQGGGSVENAKVLTDANGVASSGKWIGTSLGTNKVVASIDGGQSIEFTAEVIAAPQGTFELATIDGQPLPQWFWWFEGEVLSGTIAFGDNAKFAEAFTYIEDGIIREYTGSGLITPAINLRLDNFRTISIDGNTLTLTFSTISEIAGKFVFKRVGTS